MSSSPLVDLSSQQSPSFFPLVPSLLDFEAASPLSFANRNQWCLEQHWSNSLRPSYLTSVHFLQRLRVQTKPPPSLAINLVVSLPPRISSIGEPSRTGNHPCRVRIRSGHPQAFAIADQIPIQFGIISHVFSHCLNCSFTCGKLNNFRCSSVDIKIPFLPLGICLKTPDERGSEARFGGVG